MGDTTCLAVVTARSGSKGVIRKNERLLAGRHPLEYVWDVVQGCPYITDTLLTTDSEIIQEVGLKLGMRSPFLRPSDLATDTAAQEDAVLHAVQWEEDNGRSFDFICLLEPTLPLRKSETLCLGFQALNRSPGCEGVFSVTKTRTNPMFTAPLGQEIKPIQLRPIDFMRTNRQQIPEFCTLSSVVVIIAWDVFKREKRFLTDRTISLLVDSIESTDIDEPVDFLTAERLIQLGVRDEESLSKIINAEGLPT